MKFAKSFLTGTGAVVLAGLVLTLVAPKAARAVTATLVEVVNTRSTPVPNQDVDNPGRHPYQQTCNSGSSVVQSGFMSCQMPPIPPNTEVVIQNVTVDVNLGPGPQQLGLLLATGGGVTGTTEFPLVSLPTRYLGTQATTLYADPGTQITCAASVSATGFFGCSVSGYTVSLP